MAAAFGASDLCSEALFGETAVVEAGQGINHRQVAENIGMILLFEKLLTKTLNEDFLIDRIDIEKHDQGDQAKDSLGQLDFEECFRTGQKRRKRERDHGKGKE